MGKFYEEIPSFIIPWIQQQKMFWTATAPLTGNGHVNVSPKGTFDTTFHVVNSRRVWYEDLSGSGNETVAHLREKGNGRITVLFHAFEGPPRICRLFGTGTVYEFGSPEYDALLPANKRQPGSRAVIMIDIYKVGTSCGYAIPVYQYKADRYRLHIWAADREAEDVKHLKKLGASPDSLNSVYPEKGLRWYWQNTNVESLDGLPALESAYNCSKEFDPNVDPEMFKKDDERFLPRSTNNSGKWFNLQTVTAFVVGAVVASSVVLHRQQR